MIQQLKSGIDPDEQETVEELLEVARARVLAAVPREALVVLEGLSPQLLESYALLCQQVGVGKIGTGEDAVIRQGYVRAPVNRSIEAGDMEEDGLMVKIVADTPEEQAFLNELSGMFNEGLAPSQVERGGYLYVPPLVTDEMLLDPFQGVYKGYAEVVEGKGKKARKTTRTIAVHKAIYEAELGKVGDQVKDPGYWLPLHNAMTVYFPEERYEIGLDWLLGNYDPQMAGIPAGIDPTPEQIVQWMQDGIDDIRYEIEVIKRHLRTPQQKQWLEDNDITINDALTGGVENGLDVEANLFDAWNMKLGVKVYGY
jgi:hypothetical protein